MQSKPSTSRGLIPRRLYLEIVATALAAAENRFASEAIVQWLAAYPGDLQAGLLYARALLREGRSGQAGWVLHGLCQCDPEFVEAVDLLSVVGEQAAVHSGGKRAADRPANPAGPRAGWQDPGLANGWQFALTGRGAKRAERESHISHASANPATTATWAGRLWQARAALKSGDLTAAEEPLRDVLGADPPLPLAAVTHLRLLEKQPGAPLPARLHLAELYHRRWPDCLQCTLLLADWLSESGASDRAVRLLHQAAASDVGGQVAARMWGEDHPYRGLWPEGLELALRPIVPAAVVTALGWNRLPPGAQPQKTLKVSLAGWDAVQPEDLACQVEGEASKPVGSSSQEVPDVLRPVREALDRLGAGLAQPDVTAFEGRFPVYVVFSVRAALAAKYGAQAAVVEESMQRLVQAVDRRRGWAARLFLADDPACTGPLGLNPARPGDAWGLKLALADLDAALRGRGEMIAALLIVGGPEIVPFHHLPNPVDDDDAEVPSDNPYGTRDENYFVQEWPVGRMPDGTGPDPSLLLSTLEAARHWHASQERAMPWYRRWWVWLRNRFSPPWPAPRPSFGYTAAIWRPASLTVFRPVGDPAALLVSPPLSLNGSGRAASGEQAANRGRLAGSRLSAGSGLPEGRLGYFNLHGLADSGEWYGQRDPFEGGDGPDYPIALRPEDIATGRPGQNPALPQVIFSEACYGAHILGKHCDEALALKFLAGGVQAMVGATCMAYGSISPPLIAADLLGQAFWNGLRSGLPAGEALRQARLHLARSMHDRQGYLDGEDQKTLISFVLYGDPLAHPGDLAVTDKRIRRATLPPAEVNTVCDRCRGAAEEPAPPPEVLAHVRHIVAQYLPGMTGAQVAFSQEHTHCDTTGHNCPTGQLGGKRRPAQGAAGRRLVTLSKHVPSAQHVHPQYARLTLDAQGKLVKLVVSR